MIDPFINPAHVQGSPEWLENRRNYIGASDAGVILGLSPWKTPYQLWLEKLGRGEESNQTFAMLKGTQLEPFARSSFERDLGLDVFPDCVYHPEHDFMMASLDGITLDRNIVVELKSGLSTYKMAKEAIIPEYYKAQLQHQLACIGLNEIYYYSYDEQTDSGICIKVYRDDEYIKKLIDKEKEFWVFVTSKNPPPLTDRDYEN